MEMFRTGEAPSISPPSMVRMALQWKGLSRADTSGEYASESVGDIVCPCLGTETRKSDTVLTVFPELNQNRPYSFKVETLVSHLSRTMVIAQS